MEEGVAINPESVQDAEPLRVLIVEDNPDDADLLFFRLESEGFRPDFRRVDTRQAYLDALSSIPPPDIILSDWSVPGFGGLKALDIRNEVSSDIPFIIVSGKIGEEAAVDILRRGAYDYVSKDNLSRVGQSVRHALEDRRARVEARRAEDALRASEAKYRAFTEATQDVVFIKDATGRFIMVNRAAEAHYGRPESAILGQSTVDFLPPDVAATCRASDTAALLGTGISTHVEHYRGRIFETRKFPILMGGERMIGGYIRDITDQYVAERKLEAEVRVSAILREYHTRETILAAALDLLRSMDGVLEARYEPPFPALWDASTKGSELPARIRLPLNAQNQYLGDFLLLRERQPESTDLEIFHLVSGLIANALHLADLRKETNDRLGKLTALALIDESIGADSDLGATLELVLDQAMAMLDAQAASIFLMEESGQILRLAVSRGFSKPRPIPEVVLPGQAYIGMAVSERRTIAVNDFSGLDPESPFALLVRGEGFSSYLCTPLQAKTKILGAMGIYPRSASAFDPEFVGFFETIARQASIAIENKTLYRNEQKAREALVIAYDATIEGWSRAMDLRDEETEGHSQRVTSLAMELGRKFGFEGEALANIMRGSLLHDIGKVGIPDSVLRKPGPLTQEEWVIMRKHPVYALEMLSPIEYLRPALDIPCYHHEKWDGSGYPRGLAHEEIPLAARIFAVIDVWDALRSDRPYRKAWSAEKALSYIIEQSGSHFDPKVVEVFRPMVEALAF